MVSTSFWDDSWVAELEPTQKYLFLYLLTNPLTNISGVYEVRTERIVFDSGLKKSEVTETLSAFEKAGKIVRESSWIGIVNFTKHQSLNPKVKRGIVNELRKAPTALVDKMSLPKEIGCTLMTEQSPSKVKSLKPVLSEFRKDMIRR